MSRVRPANNDPELQQYVRFRTMSRADAEAVRPNPIGLYTAREGDTWQSIAERAGRGLARPATPAIMSGHAIDDQPRAGERLKIVVAG